jgi:hypothetical protein
MIKDEQMGRDQKSPCPVSNENLTRREVTRKPARPDPMQSVLSN